jgi:diaminohydroxyphosphoribosylaminopyrimidine deaminase / 5-amino-6-(5-phosphoribosylamino)uracil reductase
MPAKPHTARDESFMREALALAERGRGFTSPNPSVGAVLVKSGRVIGRGFHRQAGKPHAEIEALRDADRRGQSTKSATLYVTLEPCCTHGRTPPCTEAILTAGIRRVNVAATDPNPRHAGRGLRLLRRHGLDVHAGVLRAEATRLNEAFNHWIVHRTPFVTVKAALTLDGRIATATGDSQWITGVAARRHAMQQLRRNADAILVGINTILADDPSLTYRGPGARRKSWRRIVLDSQGRTPLTARVVTDLNAAQTLIVVASGAPAGRVAALRQHCTVVEAPAAGGRIDLGWLLTQLGGEGITSLLVEGGGEVNAAFLEAGLVQRVAFYYAPRILGGRNARPAVGGDGAVSLATAHELADVEFLPLGRDWLVTGLIRRLGHYARHE